MFTLLDEANVNFALRAGNPFFLPYFLSAAAPKVRNEKAKRAQAPSMVSRQKIKLIFLKI